MACILVSSIFMSPQSFLCVYRLMLSLSSHNSSTFFPHSLLKLLFYSQKPIQDVIKMFLACSLTCLQILSGILSFIEVYKTEGSHLQDNSPIHILPRLTSQLTQLWFFSAGNLKEMTSKFTSFFKLFFFGHHFCPVLWFYSGTEISIMIIFYLFHYHALCYHLNCTRDLPAQKLSEFKSFQIGLFCAMFKFCVQRSIF